MNLKHIRRSEICLNCETTLDIEKDYFCPVCGQLNNTRKETAIELVRELAGDFLHLDSKVTRNFIPLLFRPGKLTLDYLAGKRARYFHPVRLFLIVTVIMFLIDGLSHDKKKEPVKSDYVFSLNTKDGLQVEKDTTPGNLVWELGDRSVADDSLKKLILVDSIQDADQLMDTLGIEKSFLGRLFTTQLIKSHVQGFGKLSDYFRHKLPWIIFTLMPVFAFVLWLIYIRKRIYFSDHLIFAFHLHTAVFVITAIADLLGLLSSNAHYLLYTVPLYYFISLKNVYQQSWRKTMVKGLLIGFMYFALGLITFLIVSAVLLLNF